MRTSLILAVLLSLVHPGSARAQSQITTGVIDGVATDATGAALPGVTIEARNVDTNFTRTSVTAADGRFALLQLPPGRYKVTFTLSGFATLVQENLELTVGQSVTLAASMKVSGVAETVTVTAAAGRGDADGRPPARSNQTTIEIDADSRPQVRGSADAHARRQHRAGAGRRRDHLRRTARHLQQHQPRRRRLQQRLLRRAGRRPARGHRHHARSGQGVPGHRDRRAGRVRPHRRRRGQRHHQVGHEPDARQPVLLPAARRR